MSNSCAATTVVDMEITPTAEWSEAPFQILETYFAGQYLERLVRHQIESYNHFCNFQLPSTIQMFNPIVVHSENDFIPETGKYALDVSIQLDNFKIYPPQIHENNGATKLMFPQEARLRNFTYASNMTVDVVITYTVNSSTDFDAPPRQVVKILPKINIGKLPIMLKSSICLLTQNKQMDYIQTGECKYDCGGYFIINGSEKTVLAQERAAENRVYCFCGKNTTKWSWYAEIKSVPDYKCISPKQIEMLIANKNNGFGHAIYINIPRIKTPIELFVLFRALGVLGDGAICRHILLDISVAETDDKQHEMLEALRASIMDANKYMTQEDAIHHITAHAAFVPINMDKEAGAAKKREFTLEVLRNDLFPHCRTREQKIYFLGYMANVLLQTSLGWLPPDDRDSYVNKRIDLNGTLINNLFRNHMNKLVKEIQKQVVREINNSTHRNTEDYENIINMVNIYKIIKPTTIENGLKRALSTGDFSIKQTNSTKVGVAQVLNRLTYAASLSHLRRINTPMDKSGELIAPRKLHNTSAGMLCCLTGDTYVLCQYNLLRKIRDLCDGDIVITVNRTTLKEEPSEIYNFFCKMPDKLYKLTTNVGTKIKATGDHPFLVCVGEGKYEMRTVDELHLYDMLVVTSEPQKYNIACLMSIVEIEPELVFDFTTRSDNHSFVANSFVVSNCAESPEGQSIGLVKNLSYMTHVTIPSNSAAIYEYVAPFLVVSENPADYYMRAKVFVNGAWLGITERPLELYQTMKQKKYQGMINIYTSVVFDYKMGAVRICNDSGRMTRPLLRVQNNRLIITARVVERLNCGELKWNDLLHEGAALPQSVIEYLDTEELNCGALVAMKPADLARAATDGDKYMNYTHCEIHPSTMFGVLGSCIPFPEHNQSPRNAYQACMSKQSMGVYATNFDQRMDKTAYVLTYPSRPLVDTRLMNFIKLNEIPSGRQVIVAIMTHTGYNQEDSILMNKGSIDRGLFMATVYHTEKDENKKINGDEQIRCRPEPNKTKGMKFGNYSKLNTQGFIPENTRVENQDIIIGKVLPIKENRNDPSKTVKYEDQSKSYKTFEETYIDKNYMGRNGDGYNFAKVRTRTLRKPVLGDKFACALPTQQVLTHLGWVEMKDIDCAVHRVCTLDRAGNMIYEHPVQKFEYDHEGQMYYVENKQLHMICTLNHKLYIQRRYGKQYELAEAQDVMGKMVRFQKALNNAYPDVEEIVLGDKIYKMDDWLLLLGMFLGDGSVNNRCVSLSALRERKVLYNTELLTKLGVEFKHDPKNGYFAINKGAHPEIYEELEKYSVGALNKYLPEYVWMLSQRQSRILMEALMSSDGHVMSSPKGHTDFSRYSTISHRLADDIMRLATHCGWSGIVKIKVEPDGKTVVGTRRLGARAGTEVSITSKHTLYSISIITKQNQPWINKKENDANIEKLIDYTGKVYCIEMPSSNLYYFRENNFTASMLSGNSKQSQKGTLGNIIPEENMPFTKAGIRPDIIINPHSQPSRMTAAQLKEMLLSKALSELGMFGDGTAFGELDIQECIAKCVQDVGYESYGNEILYNGITGEQVEVEIFMGPCFYQRLKHMVSDKVHSRAQGPMVILNRQPTEGRSKGGGLRLGEMERDVLSSGGYSAFLRERFYQSSDRFSVYTCNKCGLIAAYNDKYHTHFCRTCENKSDFSYLEIPYACKLLFQELQTINVVPRFMTEPNIAQIEN